MRIFVGNLGPDISAGDLFTLFSQYGEVSASHVPKDNLGSLRGFGYIIMPTDREGKLAINALDKKPFMEQFLTVSEAIHSDVYEPTTAPVAWDM